MAEQRWHMNIVGHGEVDPRELVPHPFNPKVHPVEQDAVVEASLRELGWIKSLLVNRTTGRVLDGHERLALALRRGEQTVPVEYVEVPEEREGIALRTIDPSGQMAHLHLARWAALQQTAQTQEPALTAFWDRLAREQQQRNAAAQASTDGEDDDEWQGSWAADRETQEAEVAAQTEAVRQRWGVELGQVWQLGRHQVWCGDSTEQAGVTAWLAPGSVDLVVTSPPYAVAKDYEHGSGIEAHRALLRGLGARCQTVVRPGGFVVVNFAEVWAQVLAKAWTRRERACLYPMSLEYWQIFYGEYSWDLYASRIWTKPFAKLRQPLWTYHTSLAHQQEWEYIWTWRLPGGTGEQVYDWQTSVHAVWDSQVEWVDPDGRGPWKHWVAGFPQWIPAQMLQAHSAVGAVVWEPFLGGGTTLLACEDLGRTCYGSDQQPGALAVTMARWVEAGGETPRRLR